MTRAGAAPVQRSAQALIEDEQSALAVLSATERAMLVEQLLHKVARALTCRTRSLPLLDPEPPPVLAD